MRQMISLVRFASSLVVLALAAGCATPGDDPPAETEEAAEARQAITIAGDCLGGAFVNGKCQPLVVASGQHRPFSLATDGTRAYWTASAGAAVGSASVLGDGVRLLASGAQNAAGPAGVAVGGGHVFYTTEQNGKIWRVAPDGSNQAPVAIATDQGDPIQVVTDGYYVYWTDYAGGRVARIKTRPAANEGVEVLAANQASPWGLAIRGKFLYWTNATPNAQPANGAVSCVNLETGAITSVTSAGAPGLIDAPYSIAVDETYVYWIDYHTGKVHRAPTDPLVGFLPALTATIASGQWGYGLAVDGGYVYWTDALAGRVMRASRDGSGLQAIAEGQMHPIAITTDALAVYWVNDDNDGSSCVVSPCGTVMRLAKP
jgi:sugar lactone lactonase YvrE